MKPDDFDAPIGSDLLALSAAAEGRPVHGVCSCSASPAAEIEDAGRNLKVAELKARFEAGALSVDESQLASKLLDAHIKSKPASQK